ncbi:MAG: LTA synthase family protein [Elusimicrobiales bacterium]|nr:LTA synthase family protein [Elusimicrobiales bacterium]
MMKFFSRLPDLPRISEAVSRFFNLLPALLLAFFFLRAAEMGGGIETGAAYSAMAGVAAAAVWQDMISLARYLPALFLYSLPFLLPRSRRVCFWGLGLAWSLLLLVQTSLVQYFLTARVPLGADLFSYDLTDIITTTEGGLPVKVAAAAGLLLALSGFWSALLALSRSSRQVLPKRIAFSVLAAALLVMAGAPKRSSYAGSGTEYIYDLTLNKAAYFFDDSFSYLVKARLKKKTDPEAGPVPAPSATGFRYLDPKYPFLREERTPDVLGPQLQIKPGSPPNLVFIIVEGLGRAFSGPDAHLGSFTPELDKIAENSLYWENFLAVQGRTFGILPSLFSSLPFGDEGFAELGERMPPHVSLLSVLKANKYRLKCYVGFDMNFDNDRSFYRRQGADLLVDENDFGPGYVRSNSWGYADNDLVSRALESEAQDAKQPFVSVLKTTTMHTPYTFNGQKDSYAGFERYLDKIGIAEKKKDAYREYRNIYTSILYTDRALGRFFEEMKKKPSYQNTVFIITGDHRLPEIPLATRIDRFHVPLIIFSPLLKAPARIKSVSSHFDVAPSLLAFFSRNYGFQTPSSVTWLGSGLDMEPSFRNVHEFPMKQTKTNLVDFVSGTWYLNQETLYKLGDGMDSEPVRDSAALALIQSQFAAFRAANDQFARTLAIAPGGVGVRSKAYAAEAAVKAPAPQGGGPSALSVSEVLAPEEAQSGKLTIKAVFANTGRGESDPFVPLVVLLGADGREVSESYGPQQQLAPGKTVALQLPIKSAGAAPGRYFLAVIPSHPMTGKRVGGGKFHIPVALHD